jgi:hypothetical protein
MQSDEQLKGTLSISLWVIIQNLDREKGALQWGLSHRQE